MVGKDWSQRVRGEVVAVVVELVVVEVDEEVVSR
jgi:hypothetical protein